MSILIGPQEIAIFEDKNVKFLDLTQKALKIGHWGFSQNRKFVKLSNYPKMSDFGSDKCGI